MNTSEYEHADGGAAPSSEQAISVHHFNYLGALGRTCLFLFGTVMCLLIGLGCLAGALVSLERSLGQALLWAVFSGCGFISTFALLREVFRIYRRIPSTIEVYRSGLRWYRRGQATDATWDDVTKVDRQVTVVVHAGREHRTDTTLIEFTTGESWLIWSEVLTDYPTFADSVKYFHGSAGLGTVHRPDPARLQQREVRCWHCGASFEVSGDPSAQVRCPQCKAGLGVLRS